ncbi:hypothetical protein K9N68_05575 [Kovacikia minuta CCNUW1]|uniref:hypothetical protein n=1 Tax=Kovacikia minuta TaxID=2931930 RepID=UPI001CCF7774|nr:hypothetical protein [Kovacikia minuta]UBF27418.1 hypothetical protein K9N68_05575 [Kovacikia minuta CCNUW1]
MAENPGSPSEPSKPEPSKNENSFKALIAKGMIGAISLAGATGIPLMVQKYLGSPTPAASPTPSVSTQIAPAQVVPSQVQPSGNSLEQTVAQEEDHKPRGKRKKKNKDNDD